MSEEIKPVVNEVPADVENKEQEVKAPVADKVAEVADQVKEKVEEKVEEVMEAVVNYGEKTLSELSDLFQSLTESVDRMKRSKEAEAIKSAFYKRLSREKAEAGEDAAVEEPDENTPVEETTVPLQSGPLSPFAAIEAGFKSLYVEYKKERAEYNKEQDAQREENLQKKQAIIEEL